MKNVEGEVRGQRREEGGEKNDNGQPNRFILRSDDFVKEEREEMDRRLDLNKSDGQICREIGVGETREIRGCVCVIKYVKLLE